MNMFEIFSYVFIQKAFLAGIMIALLCALIGPFLVLRRMSLLGDGLAHVAFSGIAFGLLLEINPFLSALAFAVVASLLLQKLTANAKMYGDSAIAIILSLGIAVALLAIGLSGGFNVDLFSYLFGSILTITDFELFLIGAVFLLAIIFFLFYSRQLFFMIFNEDLAKLSGVNVTLSNNVFAVVTALAIVVGIKAVGIMLVSALLVLPTIIALQISGSFRQSVAYSAVFGLFSVVFGILLSAIFDFPPSSIIILLNCLVFCIVLAVKKIAHN